MDTDLTFEDKREILNELQSDCDKKISLLDGFEGCLHYYTTDEYGNIRSVYCYEDLIEYFMVKNNCSYEDAVDFIEYNTMRTIPYMSHIGKTKTTIPLIIHRIV